MQEKIAAQIRRFAEHDPGNRASWGGFYFDEPLVGFAAADDPLFADYKRIIGPFHLAPQEILPEARTVIVWSLSVSRQARESNRRQERVPSREWAFTRAHGEAFNSALRRHMTAWLQERGHRAVAPQLSSVWKELAETPAGIASTWSERHAAYAAGLGTFSLNDALITRRGIAHRLGSIVTDLPLPPSPRPWPDHRHNCLWHRKGTCGICIGRCPVGALSPAGHDKERCRDYVYGALPAELSSAYGVPQTGCGLCQAGVPCEAGIPGAAPDGAA